MRALFLAAVATATAIAAATAPAPSSHAANRLRLKGEADSEAEGDQVVREAKPAAVARADQQARQAEQRTRPATESLHRCEEAATRWQNAIAEDGEGDKFTDTLWNPLEDEARVLYAHEGPVLDDCTVGVPDGWERLSNRCDCPVLISDGISVRT